MPRRRITLSRFARKVAAMGPTMERAVERGLRSAALALSSYVVQEIDSAEPFPAVDRSELRNSVVVRGSVVSVDAPHAAIIEYGTRPFFPPLAPLARWAMRKGLASDWNAAMSFARAVARKFSIHGMAPRHYFAKAWKRFERDGVLAREIKLELRRMRLI